MLTSPPPTPIPTPRCVSVSANDSVQETVRKIGSSIVLFNTLFMAELVRHVDKTRIAYMLQAHLMRIPLPMLNEPRDVAILVRQLSITQGILKDLFQMIETHLGIELADITDAFTKDADDKIEDDTLALVLEKQKVADEINTLAEEMRPGTVDIEYRSLWANVMLNEALKWYEKQDYDARIKKMYVRRDAITSTIEEIKRRHLKQCEKRIRKHSRASLRVVAYFQKFNDNVSEHLRELEHAVKQFVEFKSDVQWFEDDDNEE